MDTRARLSMVTSSRRTTLDTTASPRYRLAVTLTNDMGQGSIQYPQWNGRPQLYHQTGDSYGKYPAVWLWWYAGKSTGDTCVILFPLSSSILLPFVLNIQYYRKQKPTSISIRSYRVS